MERSTYNWAYWPTFLMAVMLSTLSGMAYDPAVTSILGFLAFACEIGAIIMIINRLTRTKVSAWWTLVVFIPFGQLVLCTVTAFLKDADSGEGIC